MEALGDCELLKLSHPAEFCADDSLQVIFSFL